ncbi:MAG: hypothetical protein HY609_04655 [Deltaproteobacteria bacterium]|nr:hypothetical protein [Deltaproteobacteria bacterium]
MGLSLTNIMKQAKGAEEEREPRSLSDTPQPSLPPAEKNKPVEPTTPRQAEDPASTSPKADFLFTQLRGSKEELARLKKEEDLPSFETSVFEKKEETQKELSKKYYMEILQWTKQILDKAGKGEILEGSEIHRVVEKIVKELLAGNRELLSLACSQFTWKGEAGFLIAKMVNNAILAVEIGVGKKMAPTDLVRLGLASFLNYLGITQILDVVTKKEMLKGEDLKKVQEIPSKTVEILKKIPRLDQTLLKVVVESRERIDGSGPLGIKGIENLDPVARIIAVIDVFEALIHDRPHRKRLMPYEAIKKILAEGEQFEEDVLRLLIDRVGIYPVKSWVRLTTKQIAQIVECNPGQPFRPKVKVMFDEEGHSLERTRLLNLGKDASIQIAQPVPDEEFQKLCQPKG